jgi:hypothetical protein
MVRSGLLEPRSAQDVARLPAEEQFAFAEAAVRAGLPKSAIELLVASYNDAGCPGAVKAQILSDPRAALARMADKRRAVSVSRPDARNEYPPQCAVNEAIKSAKLKTTALHNALRAMPTHKAAEYGNTLMELESILLALIATIRRVFSPGKTEVGNDGG